MKNNFFQSFTKTFKQESNYLTKITTDLTNINSTIKELKLFPRFLFTISDMSGKNEPKKIFVLRSNTTKNLLHNIVILKGKWGRI